MPRRTVGLTGAPSTFGAAPAATAAACLPLRSLPSAALSLLLGGASSADSGGVSASPGSCSRAVSSTASSDCSCGCVRRTAALYVAPLLSLPPAPLAQLPADSLPLSSLPTPPLTRQRSSKGDGGGRVGVAPFGSASDAAASASADAPAGRRPASSSPEPAAATRSCSGARLSLGSHRPAARCAPAPACAPAAPPAAASAAAAATVVGMRCSSVASRSARCGRSSSTRASPPPGAAPSTAKVRPSSAGGRLAYLRHTRRTNFSTLGPERHWHLPDTWSAHAERAPPPTPGPHLPCASLSPPPNTHLVHSVGASPTPGPHPPCVSPPHLVHTCLAPPPPPTHTWSTAQAPRVCSATPARRAEGAAPAPTTAAPRSRALAQRRRRVAAAARSRPPGARVGARPARLRLSWCAWPARRLGGGWAAVGAVDVGESGQGSAGAAIE
eukprot:357637-Chlamydomonas_euryale.AAC.1